MAVRLRLDVYVPAEWARIDPVREAVGVCVAATLDAGELRDAVAMVSAELLENAMKYGRTDAEGPGLTVVEDNGIITVAVTNAVDEASGHVSALRARIAWVARFADPAEAYRAALEEVASHASVDDDRERADSGLGIVRMAYEAGCELSCESAEAGRLTVRARRPIALS